MQRSIARLISQTLTGPAAAIIIVLWSSQGLGELINEFPYPELGPDARQASALMMDAISTVFQALGRGEQNKPESANAQIGEALNTLESSGKMFEAIKKRSGGRKIDPSRVPSKIGAISVDSILNYYGYKQLPATVGELADMAIDQIKRVRMSASALQFGPGKKEVSRAAVPPLADAVRQVLALGVVISILADAAN